MVPNENISEIEGHVLGLLEDGATRTYRDVLFSINGPRDRPYNGKSVLLAVDRLVKRRIIARQRRNPPRINDQYYQKFDLDLLKLKEAAR